MKLTAIYEYNNEVRFIDSERPDVAETVVSGPLASYVARLAQDGLMRDGVEARHERAKAIMREAVQRIHDELKLDTTLVAGPSRFMLNSPYQQFDGELDGRIEFSTPIELIPGMVVVGGRNAETPRPQ